MKKFILALLILPLSLFGENILQEKLNKDLLLAIDYKDYALVEKLLKMGAKPDAIDEYGSTALEKSLNGSCRSYEGPPGVHTCNDNQRTAAVLLKYIEKSKVAVIPLGKEAQDQMNKNVRDQLNKEYLRTLDWLANVKWVQTTSTASSDQLWHWATYL